jgi:hypothetical protein
VIRRTRKAFQLKKKGCHAEKRAAQVPDAANC